MNTVRNLAAKYKVTAKKSVEDVVDNMMSDVTFNSGIPDMLSAAKTALHVAHLQKSIEMAQFNTLVLAYLKAIQAKSASAAVSAANDLIHAGHGEAFGF